MIQCTRLLGTFTYSMDSLLLFDISKFTFDEVKKTWKDIQKVTSTVDKCGTWRGKRVSLAISKSVADIEDIKNFVALDNKKEKSSRSKYSDEFLEEVKKYLPEQPWPKGVHDIVSKKMGISPKTAAIVIGELMRKGMVKKQKDGKIIE